MNYRRIPAVLLAAALSLSLVSCSLIPTAGDEEGLSEFIDSSLGYNGAGDLTYERVGEILNDLGIDCVTDELIEKLKEEEKNYPDDYTPNRITEMLTAIGIGEYDNELHRTPVSTKVYAFDFEAFNTDTMYTEYLNGISAIGDGKLDFTDIKEDLDEVDTENGSGIRKLSFTWNKETYTIEAIENYDWLDSGVMNQLSDIIASANTGKNLYYSYDANQMCIAFYCTPEWAARFSDRTGIDLYLKFYT